MTEINFVNANLDDIDFDSSSMKCTLTTAGDFGGNYTVGDTLPDACTGWHYWSEYYYPRVIKESYPVYIQERAQDKGKQAYEIVKMLIDKKIIELKTAKDFVGAMDELIKIL